MQWLTENCKMVISLGGVMICGQRRNSTLRDARSQRSAGGHGVKSIHWDYEMYKETESNQSVTSFTNISTPPLWSKKTFNWQLGQIHKWAVQAELNLSVSASWDSSVLMLHHVGSTLCTKTISTVAPSKQIRIANYKREEVMTSTTRHLNSVLMSKSSVLLFASLGLRAAGLRL